MLKFLAYIAVIAASLTATVPALAATPQIKYIEDQQVTLYQSKATLNSGYNLELWGTTQRTQSLVTLYATGSFDLTYTKVPSKKPRTLKSISISFEPYAYGLMGKDSWGKVADHVDTATCIPTSATKNTCHLFSSYREKAIFFNFGENVWLTLNYDNGQDAIPLQGKEMK